MALVRKIEAGLRVVLGTARGRAFLPLLFASIFSVQALAVQPGERLADPSLEARARALSSELRCLVCQNQSIDNSDAPLAHDLRLLVRERLKAGDSDAEVKNFLVARYGEFVLLRPAFDARTALLWTTPLLVLLLGGLAAWTGFRRRAAAAPEALPLTADEKARLARLDE